MSTVSESMTNGRPSGRQVNWNVVVVSVLLGLVMGGAAVVGGKPWLGLVFLCIMLAMAALLGIVSRFSDTVALMGDDVRDERHVHVHQRSALYTLNILAFVLIGGFVLDIARGGDGGSYAFLGAVGGVTYVVCLLILSRRS